MLQYSSNLTNMTQKRNKTIESYEKDDHKETTDDHFTSSKITDNGEENTKDHLEGGIEEEEKLEMEKMLQMDKEMEKMMEEIRGMKETEEMKRREEMHDIYSQFTIVAIIVFS